MKLDKKKRLAAKVLGVGKQRIVFLEPRLNEIKEAITKDDIRSLRADGAIMIKEIRGKRLRQNKRKTERSPGNIRKNAKNSKREYMIITRKLRKHILELKGKNLLTRENFLDLRKKIKNRFFKSKSQLKEYLKTELTIKEKKK
ncbi:MAG: 50S ribosomal protein L19e [Candidatus Nanoarchaeia archaeon]|nr:50S ribosomal protein L19e [Candidatus Nanoarchaeia archaeon]